MGSRAGEEAVIIKLLRGDREILRRFLIEAAGEDEQPAASEDHEDHGEDRCVRGGHASPERAEHQRPIA